MRKGLLFTTVLVFLVSCFAVSASTDFISVGDYVVEYSYDEASPGDRLSLSVTLENEGDDLSDVRFELDERFPFNIVGNDYFELDTLLEGESYTKNFRLEISNSALDTEYSLGFDLEDSDDDYSDIFEIDVDAAVPEFIIGSLSSSPGIITADTEDVSLSLTLENIGDDARYFRVKLVLPEGFENSGSYSDLANLGSIYAGSSKDVTFFFDTLESLNDGVHVAELHFEYEDVDGNYFDEVLEFDVPVKGKPLFKVTNSKVTTSEVVPGAKDVTLRVTVLNEGTVDGKETSVRVFENSDLPLEFNEKTNFLGTLEKGQSGTAVFTFNVDSEAKANDYRVKVQVRTINEGSVLVSEETIVLTVNEKVKSDFGSLFRNAGVALLLVVGLLAAVVIVKKR